MTFTDVGIAELAYTKLPQDLTVAEAELVGGAAPYWTDSWTTNCQIRGGRLTCSDLQPDGAIADPDE